MLILEDDLYILHYEEENSLSTTHWKPLDTYLQDNVFKNQISKWFNDLKTRPNPKKIFVDITHLNYTIPPFIQDWFDENIFSVYPELGIEKKAFVVSPDIFTQISIEQHAEPLENLFVEVRYFDCEESAREWLLS